MKKILFQLFLSLLAVAVSASDESRGLSLANLQKKLTMYISSPAFTAEGFDKRFQACVEHAQEKRVLWNANSPLVSFSDNECYEGKAPLFHAIVLKQPVFLDRFIDKYKPDLDAKGFLDKETALHIAVTQGDECVKTLLEHGANSNVTDLLGRTPLHNAATVPNPGVARTLLEYDANVHVQDEEGNTPLHDAALFVIEAHQDVTPEKIGDCKDTLEVLLKNGAHPGIPNEDSEMPSDFILSAQENDKFRDIIEMFNSYRAVDENAKEGGIGSVLDLHRSKDIIPVARFRDTQVTQLGICNTKQFAEVLKNAQVLKNMHMVCGEQFVTPGRYLPYVKSGQQIVGRTPNKHVEQTKEVRPLQELAILFLADYKTRGTWYRYARVLQKLLPVKLKIDNLTPKRPGKHPRIEDADEAGEEGGDDQTDPFSTPKKQTQSLAKRRK